MFNAVQTDSSPKKWFGFSLKRKSGVSSGMPATPACFSTFPVQYNANSTHSADEVGQRAHPSNDPDFFRREYYKQVKKTCAGNRALPALHFQTAHTHFLPAFKAHVFCRSLTSKTYSSSCLHVTLIMKTFSSNGTCKTSNSVSWWTWCAAVNHCKQHAVSLHDQVADVVCKFHA